MALGFGAVAAQPRTAADWRVAAHAPWPAAGDGPPGRAVTFPSHSPYTLADIGRGPDDDPPTTAQGTLFLPAGASAASPAPAVIMLHGSGGVLGNRELAYGRQFAVMGVAALAVDAFGARRDRGTSFIDRLMGITEAMLIADAYAGLRHLAAMPEIDGARIVLMGFSYGGMATLYALHAQAAEAYAPGGERFAGHAAFYAPCIARFADVRTTGAPLVMLFGTEDAIIDAGRCAEVAQDARRGGSRVEMIAYAGAYHQWDGGFAGPRRIGRNLAPCRFEVEEDGTVRDRRTFLPMSGTFLRKLTLWLCAGSEGYLIGRDDAVRAESNRDLGRFLARVFAPERDHARRD